MEINWEKDKPNTNVWDNQLYVEERQKILMKFEEAQNCTFNPCVGYRMSKRRKAVFDQVRKELSSNIAFLEKPGGFDEAVKKMGDNFQSKFPWLFKKGIIKKCWFLIQNEQFADAYSALCDRFHIKCIIQHFNPNVTKFLQDDPTSMFSFEKMGKKELQEEKLPKENFDNPKNKELLQEVFQQLMYMEAYERDIIKKIHLFEQRLPEDKKNIITQYKIKMKKASQQEINNQENQQKDQKEEKRQQLENMLKQSQDQQQSKKQKSLHKKNQVKKLLKSNIRNQKYQTIQQELESQSKFSTSKFSNITVSTYASRRELVKSIMCPLGNKCPGIVGPRWHISNVKTCVPIGANCPFAHTIQELKFQKEIESKKQILFKFLMTVAQKGMQQPKQKAWNPAGNKFQLCLGCSQKTACSECKFRTKNKDIILQLSKFTKISNQKIFQRKSFKEKQINKQIACDSLNFKLGCLQKAAIFYKLQRYNEAFDVISKAIDVVQNEVEKEIHDSEKLQEKWKKQLQLESYGNEITADTILLAQTQKSEEKTEVQKLHLYGIKTGLIGQKKHSANEFINYQIEEMYKKIELKLNHGDSNVNLMKKKIGELEELQEMVEQRDANQDFGDEIQPVDINIDIENMDKEEVEDKLREKRLKITLNKAKTKMCPTLKTSGRCPRGKNCRYAHSANELLLVRPEKLIKNLKNAIVECEKIKLFKFWNPSGDQFEPCYGRGLCNFCKMEETNKEIFNLFRLASKKTNEKIRKKENYLSKVKQKKKRHVISDKKKHLLNKTNILLIQGQHNKAFEIILNAVKLVDVNYKKDDQLNYQIEQTYLSIKKYLETKYKDLVYLHFNIDEQQKLLEQAEIVDKIDRIDIAEKTEKQNEVKKTKSSYIQQQYRRSKQGNKQSI
ncbi:hypothetical protein IMG5_010580 [Ichthyophthirius multifiliis]|uniref:C3H1-type domain-containing protein n=1 Tax=Ichthyophthirius multifiliis TaxID=5932 RepID=G0QJY9_ICHMU|nr:hypothetical protein IMG5_010580 [Ichthyophthirius multifiliis]EGR34470.1 hypothetical protein IMG5_010580 [Ichthyophthirius multifiliis]|eukprot:XP_004039774.1 hypothetical protein IMG5_010580 [Ichthyophthirius multifiliis]